MNIVVSICTSDPNIGSLIQSYPDIQTAQDQANEFFGNLKTTEEKLREEDTSSE